MIAYCGLKCHECGAYIATQENDDEKRKEIAKLWSEVYKADLTFEDINCSGCLSEGEGLFSNCNICEIRKCAIDKQVANCAGCDEYICDKLERFFEMVPEAKNNLEELR